MTKVVGDRMFLTIIVSAFTILFTWAVAFPIGIYSATHQYSWGDYGLSLLGFLGIAIPNFMLALVMLYLANVFFGTSIGGPDGSGVHRQAVVVGEGRLDPRAQLDPGVHHRRRRHRGHDPPDAREPAR